MITEWKDKKVAILGVGVEGTAVFHFLKKTGAKLWILDKKRKENLDQAFVKQAEKAGAQFVCGPEYLNNLAQFSVIVRSPGIKRLTPELVAAEKEGVVITSQIQMFFALCPCPIIGVTGTKGKGTTSSLVHAMLTASGKDVYLGGNIGTSPLEFLDKLTGSSVVVLELSSFQLQDIKQSPHIAVMLMVTSEHLDHHETLEEYIDAKRNILRFQTASDFAIVNRDYPVSNESDIHTEAKVFYVSREREIKNGCFALNGKVVVRNNGSDEEIIPTSDIFLPGKHNLENVCAAVMAAKLAGVKKEEIASVLKTFKGLEHRLELVREVGGVLYYDDSFSTTPETTIAAIEAFDKPEIVILGGSGKKSDFSQLGIVLRETKNIKALIGIGDEWERMKSHFPIADFAFPVIEGAKDMKTVVAAAAKLAQPGDIVLLSPACASFGMFQNYKERGEQFKKEVEALA